MAGFGLNTHNSLLKNDLALEYTFRPKHIPFREQEMQQIRDVIRPLLIGRNGRNLLMTGPPGVGKTLACKHVLEELEEETKEVIPVYVNCWQKNTSFKILVSICEHLNYRFVQNKRGDELFNVVKDILNKKSVVLVFDEIDKMEDLDFLYSLVEELFRKSIILISNKPDWLRSVDARIRSRLTPEVLEFHAYTIQETEAILRERIEWAFKENVWADDALQQLVERSVSLGDVRTGLYLMKEAAMVAEARHASSIEIQDAKKALEKFVDFSRKDSSELDEDTQLILSLAKQHSGNKIGDLFELYQKQQGTSGYKTFQRRINLLEQNGFIITEKLSGGAKGSTTIIKHL